MITANDVLKIFSGNWNNLENFNNQTNNDRIRINFSEVLS